MMVFPEAKKHDIRAVVLDVVRRLAFGHERRHDADFFTIADVSGCEGILRNIARTESASFGSDFEELVTDAVCTYEMKASGAPERLYRVLIGPHYPRVGWEDPVWSEGIRGHNAHPLCIMYERAAAPLAEQPQVVVRLWTESFDAHASALNSWLDVQTKYAAVNSGLSGNLFAIRTEVEGTSWKFLMWVGFPDKSPRSVRRAVSSHHFSKWVGLKRSELFVGGPHDAAWRPVNENASRRNSASVVCSALVWRDKLKEPLFVACDLQRHDERVFRRKRAVDLFLGRDPAWNEVEKAEQDLACEADGSDDELSLPPNVVSRFLDGGSLQ